MSKTYGATAGLLQLCVQGSMSGLVRLSTQHNQYTEQTQYTADRDLQGSFGMQTDNTLAVRSMMQLRSVGGLYAAAQLRL